MSIVKIVLASSAAMYAKHSRRNWGYFLVSPSNSVGEAIPKSLIVAGFGGGFATAGCGICLIAVATRAAKSVSCWGVKFDGCDIVGVAVVVGGGDSAGDGCGLCCDTKHERPNDVRFVGSEGD